jgi:hypothetical protein
MGSTGCSSDAQTDPTRPDGGAGEGGAGGGVGGSGGAGGQGGAGGSMEVDAGPDAPEAGPVSFTSEPVLMARVNKQYLYPAAAVQEGAQPGDTITFSLTKSPAGMTIDDKTGAISWTPAPGQEGPQDVIVTAAGTGGKSADQTFTINVIAAVSFTSMHPAAGSAQGGETVTITGAGFVGNINVLFDDVPAAKVQVDSDTSLTITTPAAVAGTRLVHITLDAATEATFKPGFTHLPVITSTDVSATSHSSNLAVQGFGFDPASVMPNILSVPARGGTDRRIISNESMNGTDATFTLGIGNSESGMTSGAIAALVHGLRSNWLPLMITDAMLPGELAITGSNGPKAPGQSLTLSGAGFAGVDPLTLSVLFSGSAAPATVTSINAAGTSITVTVPADAVTGPLSLSAPGRLPAKSLVAVEVTGSTPALSVLDFTPAGGLPGSALVIRGTGFDPAPAMNTVTLDGVPATILSAEAHRLVVEVPQALPFGPADIAIQTAAGTITAGMFGVAGKHQVIAGGAPDTGPKGDGGQPDKAFITGTYVAVDSLNTYFVSDGPRIRAINNTAAQLSIFGVMIDPGTIMTIFTSNAFGVGPMAVHPVTEDLYFTSGAQIFRAKRVDGTVTLYAGTPTPGIGGNKGDRLSASFNGITDLNFTKDGSFLVISDNNNGQVRAINTTGGPLTKWGINFGANVVDMVLTSGLANPMTADVDNEGSLYITTFYTVVKVPHNRLPANDPAYVASVLIAGTGVADLPEQGCPAKTLKLGTNAGLSIDPISGNLYLGSRQGLMRRIKASGGSSPALIDDSDCVDFVAGSFPAGDPIPSMGFSGDGGPAQSAAIGIFARPFVDAQGNLLISSDNRIRRVIFDANGNPGIIKTVAGNGPPAIDGVQALNVTGVGSRGIVVDAARDQYIYAIGSRVVGQSRATGMLQTLAGTGVSGNLIQPGNLAVEADLGGLRGIALQGDNVFFLESVVPRVTGVNLTTGLLSIVAGDGKLATAAEQATDGPAASSRVAVNTGSPGAAIGPDGALYFADESTVRVINLTNAPLTSFGLNLPAGWIGRLVPAPKNFGSNLSGIAFDAAGDLYVASYNTNGIRKMSATAPYTVTDVVMGDSQRHGFPEPGTAQDIRLNRTAALLFLPNGDLLASSDFSNTYVLIEADAAGLITPQSRALPIFGDGAPGAPSTRAFGPAATTGRTGSMAVDGKDLLLFGGDRLIKLAMP